MAVTGIVSGKDGALTFATGYTVGCNGWTLEVTAEEVDTSPLGTAWKTGIGGVKSWGGTFNAIIHSASLTSVTDFDIADTPSSIELTFDTTSSTDGEFTGNVVITGASVNAAVEGGPQTITFTFKGTAGLTITVAQDA